MKFFAALVIALSTSAFAQDPNKDLADFFKIITHPQTEGCVRAFTDLRLSDIAVKRDTSGPVSKFYVMGRKAAPGFTARSEAVVMELAGVKTRTASLALTSFTCRLGKMQ